mgnify:CR=1 FL=1|jgi:hypothetical protein
MKKFKCYIASDSNQETVSVVEAKNKEAAIEYFAAQKKLEVVDFLRIFSVSEWKQKNT